MDLGVRGRERRENRRGRGRGRRSVNIFNFPHRIRIWKFFLRRSGKPKKQSNKDTVRNEFLPLTIEEEAEVENALSASDSQKVLVIHKSSNIKISKKSFRCLSPGTWLNDEVVNLYLELLKEREKREPMRFLKCHFFNTFFYTKLFNQRGKYDYQAVKRWTTHQKLGYNLLDCDSILVPLHKSSHWTLAVINIKENKIQYFDSLDIRDDHVFEILTRYIKDEAEDKCRNYLNLGSWRYEHVKNIPSQKNGSDCGVFMVKYADFHSRGMPPNFTQITSIQASERASEKLSRFGLHDSFRKQKFVKNYHRKTAEAIQDDKRFKESCRQSTRTVCRQHILSLISEYPSRSLIAEILEQQAKENVTGDPT